MTFYSPLRYPGGKKNLAGYIELILRQNNLVGTDYIEPYAGGANVALALLFESFARNIFINDLNHAVYAFWSSVLFQTEDLCKLIFDIPINMETWIIQKKIITGKDSSLLELGFSTFFLNRTNRSGILTGGVIGGKEQKGKWKLDARFNKKELIRRIEKIARHKDRIVLYNLDAIDFVKIVMPSLPPSALIYFDPPYYIKGTQMLYSNFYKSEDHINLSKFIKSITNYWLISYDNVQQVKELYKDFRSIEYDLRYSAQIKYNGKEIMFFCNNLLIPNISNPINAKGE